MLEFAETCHIHSKETKYLNGNIACHRIAISDIIFLLQARTFRGHTNEKNFVGLTVNNDYIACGSETNEVVVYHKVFLQMISHPCCGVGSVLCFSSMVNFVGR